MLKHTKMDTEMCAFIRSYTTWRSCSVMKSRRSHKSKSSLARYHRLFGLLNSVASIMKHSSWRGV